MLALIYCRLDVVQPQFSSSKFNDQHLNNNNQKTISQYEIFFSHTEIHGWLTITNYFRWSSLAKYKDFSLCSPLVFLFFNRFLLNYSRSFKGTGLSLDDKQWEQTDFRLTWANVSRCPGPSLSLNSVFWTDNYVSHILFALRSYNTNLEYLPNKIHGIHIHI